MYVHVVAYNKMELSVSLLMIFFLVQCASRVRAAPCDVGCVCIRGIRTACGNTSTELDWSMLLSPGSQATVNVEPGSFLDGGHVTQLDLSSNPSIMLHNGSFSGLTNVQSLYLNDNDLKSLPDELFTPLASLMHLDLSRNDLTSVNPTAFQGLDHLESIDLTFNQLTSFPNSPLLPTFSSVSLYPNPIDCSNDNITVLLHLISSGVVADGDILRCSNTTLVKDLDFELPTTTVTMATSTSSIMTSSFVPTLTTSAAMSPSSTRPPTSMQMSPSSTRPPTSIQISPSSTRPPPSSTTAMISRGPSSTVASINTRDFPSAMSSSIGPTPTPAIGLFCSPETTLTNSGYFDWMQTPSNAMATVNCSTNEKAAYRTCMASGMWGRVNDSLCELGPAVVQLLATLSETPIIVQTSEAVSLQLTSLSTNPLTVRQLDTVTDLAEQLVTVAGDNVQVLNHTLQFLDGILQSSSDSVTDSPALTERLRTLIDTILLGALNANQTSLVLSFSHLAVGGAYLPPTNQSHLLVAIRLNNSSVDIELGGVSNNSDVTVEIDGGEGDIQVTVYDGDDLFSQSNCSNTTGSSVMGGDVLTPVISVTNENPPSGDNEEITITYGRITLTEGHALVCVRWNPISCGGGVWTMSGCALVTSSTGQLQCRCVHQGTYAVLDVPGSDVTLPTGEGQLALISRAIFYALTSLALPLYLTIIIVVAASRHLRPLPTAQCLLFLSLSQSLSLLVMMLSHGLTEVRWVCYGLGVLLHYTFLVSLSWMIVYPVLVALKVFRTMWYEKAWLIAPFAVLAWIWPAIPVGIYAGIKHSDFTEQPLLCWLEASVFPNTLTYIAAITAIVVIATVFVTLVLLACSDYTLESYIYLQNVSLFVNFALYSLVIIVQFFTAASSQFGANRSYLLLATGGLSLVCGIYFFIANGLAKSRIRSALTCRTDPVIKSKLAAYMTRGNTPDDSGFSSRTSPSDKLRRSPIRLTDEMNINYVDDYLGYPHTNPVPLAMFGQVQGGNKVVHSRKNSDISGQMYTNPLYGLQFTSEV